jgi:hypothetical protein
MRHHRAAAGGRRVAVRRRQPTAGGGWRRGRPARGCSVFPGVLAGMGPRWRWRLLWRVAAAIARLRWYPGRRVASRVAVARRGRRGRVGVARWVAGRQGRSGWRRATPARRRSARRVSCGVAADLCRARSADRPFKGDEETFDPARPDAALTSTGVIALSCQP